MNTVAISWAGMNNRFIPLTVLFSLINPVAVSHPDIKQYSQSKNEYPRAKDCPCVGREQ